MHYAVCIVGAAPVRKKPSHKVEMVNQLLFGEGMYIIKQKRNWLKIASRHDNYEGWIRNNLVTVVEENVSDNCFVTSDLINQISIVGSNIPVPIGSSLPKFNGEGGEIGGIAYKYRGNKLDKTTVKPGEEVTQLLTKQWMNAPYLWGGRTPLGVDCSGFVQVIFKMMGIDLLRDARQQEGQGIKVKNLATGRCGDLAFFKNRGGKITHVGILLSPHKIIHSSGRVRIDEMDEKGIINTDSGKRSHSLAAIRRYW